MKIWSAILKQISAKLCEKNANFRDEKKIRKKIFVKFRIFRDSFRSLINLMQTIK